MQKDLRVHIAPVGYETKRVTEPLIRQRADKVYLISHDNDDEYVRGCLQAIDGELRGKSIEIERIRLDFWNLYECIEKFREIILKERGNLVYVNVSTGSKITAMAGMLSCMLWSRTARPYFVHISYENRRAVIKPEKVLRIEDALPTYEIRRPRKDIMSVLELLKDADDGTMQKKAIIRELESKRIIEPTGRGGEKMTDPAKHSRLRTLLKPMESEFEYVKVESTGSRSTVSITEQGEKALRIFGVVDV